MPHHLGDVTTNARTAVVTGDPARVLRLAEAVGPVRDQWSRRGYVGAETEFGGRPVLVCSTGIGGPTSAILVEELHEIGIRQIVRVGTCGSLQKRVRPGDLVVATASVRDDGTGNQYLPPEFPAVADHGLTAAIIASAAASTNRTLHVGITHSKDAYYSEHAATMPFPERWRERWEALRALGVLGTEMEIAAVFVVAAVRSMRAAAVVVPTDDTMSKEATLEALSDATVAVFAGALTVERGPDVEAGA